MSPRAPAGDDRRAAIERTARERLDIERLRPGQAEAVECVLEGHDTLVVFPSGYGKTAIYQLAGALLPGPTVVVSPLIALQRDQAESINEHREAGDAATVNSTGRSREREETLEQFEEGDLEFLLLAPEQLARAETLERLREAGPSLFVVDEAHCISSWGHDFRPEYQQLDGVIEALGHPRVLALTATAAPPVRADIVERLGMRSPRTLIRGFDRPNLHLAVESFSRDEAKRSALLDAVVAAEKPGLVYTATRAGAERLAEALRTRRVRALPYHAGLHKRDREHAYRALMDDAVDVIVATTAFGMGVDKSDIRFVFHAEPSESLDAYYQEIGRAGRDGEPAEARLFYRPEDLGLRRFFASSPGVDEEQLEAVVEAVEAHADGVEVDALRGETDLSDGKLVAALNRLEESGAIEVEDSHHVEAGPRDDDEAIADAVEEQEHHRQFERSRVEMMRRYAETRDCRRATLLGYFGEHYEPPCDNCDRCEAGEATPERDDQAAAFPLDARVQHAQYGAGTVLDHDGARVLVLFDEVGYKTIDVEVAGDALRRV